MKRRVVVAGAWDRGAGYPRAASLIRALLSLGFDVEECRVEPPRLRGSKSEFLTRPWRWPGWWLQSRRARRRLVGALAAARNRGPIDAVLVPYPGHVAVRWVRSCHSGPIVLDLFLSAYGTAVEDRRLFRRGSLGARLMAWLDRRACDSADLVLLDTAEHADMVAATTGVAAHRFAWVPVSDDGDVVPSPVPERTCDEPLRVLFCGTGVPLHGLATWIDAVASTEGVVLEIIGGDAVERRRAVDVLGARVMLGPEFMPMDGVRAAIDRSHVVAGIFGTSDKAARVVPYKVAHALAHGRPVVTADTPAVRRLLTPGVDCLVAPAGDAAALATVLVSLRDEPARATAIGRSARGRFERDFAPDAIARRLGAVLAARLGFGVLAAPAATPASTALAWTC